ncbi:MAG TPA: hypothetical protein VFQ46_07935 [Candidatus Limnocylindria bacterium]|nr:hypothetical protein [Candidatus Limnocylindria bacterium]
MTSSRDQDHRIGRPGVAGDRPLRPWRIPAEHHPIHAGTSMAFAPTDRPDPPSPRIAQDGPQHLNDRLTRQQGSAALPIETKLTQTGSGTKLRCYVRDPDGHLIEVGQTIGALRHL